MTRAGLTRRHRDMLDFIRSYSEREGVAPTYDEMARGVGLRSKSNSFRLVEQLEERGYIVRLPDRARTVTLIDEPTLPTSLEQRVTDYCRRIGITRPIFDQRAAECLLRGRP